MKLPPFDYAAPATLDDALALLAGHSDGARPIAGGQSLIPVLAFRLAQPTLLVDLRRIPGLNRIDVAIDGTRLGATVRWCDIENDARLAAAHPLLVAAIAHVAHYPIRNRGTVGGSLAHADAAAELPGIAVTCDADIVVAGRTGPRTVKAADFFVGPLMTVLEPDELIVEMRLPPWPAGRRWAFEEFARQRGAFALAGIALYYDDRGGIARDAHIGVFGASTAVHRIPEAEALLNGHAVDDATIVAVAQAAAREIDAYDDTEACADYRRALVGTLVERALARAAAR